jgi:hypothetical protein
MTKIKKLSSQRRVETHGRLGKPMMLKPEHKAIVNATTLFPNRVAAPDGLINLFKSGKNNRKIGSHVTKGMWAGMPVYTLTLEERATCPTVCGSWNSCYGNHMSWPTRWKAGAELERIIPGQIAVLARRHPEGFVVRLHVLGDFYSRDYVRLWGDLLFKYQELRVYGYTRREKESPEGLVIDELNAIYSDRWRVRWSERAGEMGTTTIADVTARGRIAEGIVCPAQTEGDEVSCGSCGLCWNSSEPIVFINH